MIIPFKSRYDWMHLKLQGFKNGSEDNSIVFRTSFQIKLCENNITNENLLEKTFSTLHTSNMRL